jgi:hypothetical protein
MLNYKHVTREGKEIELCEIESGHLEKIVQYYKRKGQMCRARVYELEQQRRQLFQSCSPQEVQILEKVAKLISILQDFREALKYDDDMEEGNSFEFWKL